MKVRKLYRYGARKGFPFLDDWMLENKDVNPAEEAKAYIAWARNLRWFRIFLVLIFVLAVVCICTDLIKMTVFLGVIFVLGILIYTSLADRQPTIRGWNKYATDVDMLLSAMGISWDEFVNEPRKRPTKLSVIAHLHVLEASINGCSTEEVARNKFYQPYLRTHKATRIFHWVTGEPETIQHIWRRMRTHAHL